MRRAAHFSAPILLQQVLGLDRARRLTSMLPSADLIALARAAAAAPRTRPRARLRGRRQESAWDTHAIRYEPGFRTRYVAPLGLPPTEEVARSIFLGADAGDGTGRARAWFRRKFPERALRSRRWPRYRMRCARRENDDPIRIVIPRESTGRRPRDLSPQSRPDVSRAPSTTEWRRKPDYAAQVLARMARYK